LSIWEQEKKTPSKCEGCVWKPHNAPASAVVCAFNRCVKKEGWTAKEGGIN